MERKTIKKQIDHRYVGKKQPRWKDLKHSEYQDDDLIYVGYEEDEYGNGLYQLKEKGLRLMRNIMRE
jgi:hypothetical protein